MTTTGPAFDAVPTPAVTLGETGYTTNELNQYPQVGDIGLNYDDDGNLTNDGTLEYVYDAENRMLAATPRYPVTGSKKLEASYDYQGRRVQKRIFTYTAGTWTLDTTKTFAYDGWNVIRETTTGSSTEDYVWGLDLSGSLQGAGGIGGLLLWKTDRGTFLYLYDANGNVGQLVNNSTGALAARYEYDPFGNVLVADGPEAQNNPYRFSTKAYDAETGLYYYGYRYYSAELGRWWTRDPIDEAGGVNLYGFVDNNPVQSYDPLGLFPPLIEPDDIATLGDAAVLLKMPKFARSFYWKWRNPSAPMPPFDELRLRVETSPEYQRAKQELDDSLNAPCDCTSKESIEATKQPIRYTTEPLGYIILNAYLWQHVKCDNGKKVRVRLYTCDIYDFNKDPFPYKMIAEMGMAVNYKFYLFHEPTGCQFYQPYRDGYCGHVRQ